MIRRLIPSFAKLQLRLLQRRISDRKNRVFLLLSTSTGTIEGLIQLEVKQVIKRTSLFDNKVHNLKLASSRIEQVVIHPGEVLSFWKIVGNPSEARGYKTGRNIVNGKLQEATGGGLCQLSGILYHVFLLAGLEVIERFNHTVDIYAEADRFTPLGTDATVVYGYKDLRVRNTLKTPLQLVFSFEEEAIACSLKSPQELTPRKLTFRRTDRDKHREVETIDETTGSVIARSIYVLP